MSDLVLATYEGGGWYTLPDGSRMRGRDAVLSHYQGQAEAGDAHQHNRTLVGRQRFVRKAGLQYGGARDVYTVAGYIPEGDLDWEHYWSRYERQDIAGRIVDMAPQTTWRHPPDVVEPNEEEGTEFTEDFNKLADRLRLWHRLERADRLARIGRYGVLFLGVRDEPDAALKNPLPNLESQDDVLYLSAFHEGDVEIQSWVEDVQDPRFGQPLTYRINLSSGVANFPTAEEVVHWSRVIHVAEDLLADDVFGRPALKRVMNRLQDLEKITAATAEAYWQLADKILMLSVDPNLQMSNDDRDALGEAAEEMMHDLRRQLVGQGIEGSWLGGDHPEPGDAADLYMMLIAAASSIPKRILFGSETGERASEQDQRQWMGTIQEREQNHAEPSILRPLIDRLVDHGALPSPGEEGYEVVWPNRFQLTEKEEADLSKTRAETAKALTPVGGDPRALIRVDDENTVHLRPTEELESTQPDEEDEEELGEPGEPEGELPQGDEESEEEMADAGVGGNGFRPGRL